MIVAASYAAVSRGASLRAQAAPGDGGGGGGFPNITAPAGSLGFTTQAFTAQAGSTYRLAYLSLTSQTFADESLYAYRYKFANASDETLAIGSIQAGPWYYRVADVLADGVTVGLLSDEIGPVTAA